MEMVIVIPPSGRSPSTPRRILSGCDGDDRVSRFSPSGSYCANQIACLLSSAAAAQSASETMAQARTAVRQLVNRGYDLVSSCVAPLRHRFPARSRRTGFEEFHGVRTPRGVESYSVALRPPPSRSARCVEAEVCMTGLAARTAEPGSDRKGRT